MPDCDILSAAERALVRLGRAMMYVLEVLLQLDCVPSLVIAKITFDPLALAVPRVIHHQQLMFENLPALGALIAVLGGYLHVLVLNVEE